MFIGRPKLDKSVGNMRTTHGEELHNLYSPKITVKVKKSRSLGWASYVE